MDYFLGDNVECRVPGIEYCLYEQAYILYKKKPSFYDQTWNEGFFKEVFYSTNESTTDSETAPSPPRT